MTPLPAPEVDDQINGTAFIWTMTAGTYLGTAQILALNSSMDP